MIEEEDKPAEKTEGAVSQVEGKNRKAMLSWDPREESVSRKRQ